MRPILVQFGDSSLPSYGIIVAAGLILGVYINLRQIRHWNPRKGEREYWWLAYTLIAAGFVGGKVLAVVEMTDALGGMMWNLRSGFVWYGTLIFYVLAAFVFFRIRGYRPIEKVDFVITGLAAGHAVARLGCFLAGCCYGAPTSLPWGIRFTAPISAVPPNLRGVPLHPTQLLEFAAEFGAFLVLHFYFLPRRIAGRIAPGILMLTYFLIYATGRFFIEFLRGDIHAVRLGPLSFSQVISVILVAVSLPWALRLNARFVRA